MTKHVTHIVYTETGPPIHINKAVEDSDIEAEYRKPYPDIAGPKLTVIREYAGDGVRRYNPAETVIVHQAKTQPEKPMDRLRFVEFKLEAALAGMNNTNSMVALVEAHENLRATLCKATLLRKVMERWPEVRRVEYACFEDRSVGIEPTFDMLMAYDADGDDIDLLDGYDEDLEDVFDKVVELARDLIYLEPSGVANYAALAEQYIG